MIVDAVFSDALGLLLSNAVSIWLDMDTPPGIPADVPALKALKTVSVIYRYCNVYVMYTASDRIVFYYTSIQPFVGGHSHMASHGFAAREQRWQGCS